MVLDNVTHIVNPFFECFFFVDEFSGSFERRLHFVVDLDQKIET